MRGGKRETNAPVIISGFFSLFHRNLEASRKVVFNSDKDVVFFTFRSIHCRQIILTKKRTKEGKGGRKEKNL